MTLSNLASNAIREGNLAVRSRTDANVITETPVVQIMFAFLIFFGIG